MAKEDFDLFWRTHLVTSPGGCGVPEESVLFWSVVKDEVSGYPWTRREGSPRTHATAAAARDLMTQARVVTRRCVVTVTMLQNYSPCRDCAAELLKAINLAEEKKIKLNISITFVALNKIRRPSWINRGLCTAFGDVSINESNENILGLRLLLKAGVKLTSFNSETWRFLYAFLGQGLPSDSPGKFLSAKYSGAQSEARAEEDRWTQTDLKQILKGIHLTSPALSTENSMLPLAWSHPILVGNKVGEYRLTVRKVLLKSKEADERQWRIQSAVEGSEVTLRIPGELSSFKLTALDRDSFYDVTLEAAVKGLVVGTGRKIFKTDDKVPVQALQSPLPGRKANMPRVSSASSIASLPSASSARLHVTVDRRMAATPVHFYSEAGGLNDISEHFDEHNGSSGATSPDKAKVKGTSSLRRSNSMMGSSPRSPAVATSSRGGGVKRSSSSVGANGKLR